MIERIKEKLKKSVAVTARPLARKTRVVSYNPDRDLYVIEVAARPLNNEANTELVRFLSKLAGSKVVLLSGAKSKRKTFRIA